MRGRTAGARLWGEAMNTKLIALPILTVAAAAALLGTMSKTSHSGGTRFQIASFGGLAWRIETETGAVSVCRPATAPLQEAPVCSPFGAQPLVRNTAAAAKIPSSGNRDEGGRKALIDLLGPASPEQAEAGSTSAGEPKVDDDFLRVLESLGAKREGPNP